MRRGTSDISIPLSDSSQSAPCATSVHPPSPVELPTVGALAGGDPGAHGAQGHRGALTACRDAVLWQS